MHGVYSGLQLFNLGLDILRSARTRVPSADVLESDLPARSAEQ